MVSTQPWSDSQKRTEVYLVALEALAELVAVDLKNTIIFREATRPDAESDGWGAEDVAASKSQEPIAVTTFGDVDGHCPLSTEPGIGRDAEAECRGEGTNNVDERV